ncbi:MAG: PAS domain S-box protein, partial [Chitinophagaceae bacterium]
AQLENELSLAREDMCSITEDQEAANEELQSANEELLSSSEELQSLNEELETGKEELQSTNEELMVVNQEMIALNELLTVSRDYSEAIILNIHEPLLVLDRYLRIKTANNAFYKTFKVTEQETEGILIYNLGNRQWDIPELRMLLEKLLPEKAVVNDFKVAHTFSSIGERVMRLNAREVVNKNSPEKLILLSIEDITEREKAQGIITKSSEHFRLLVKELPAAVYSCDVQGILTFYNDAAVKLWGQIPEIGKDKWSGAFKMFNTDGSALALAESLMAKVLKEGRTKTASEEVIIERPDGSRSIVLSHPQLEFGLSGESTGAIDMLFDVTEQVIAKDKNLQDHQLLEKELEQKVQKRTLELKEANQMLLQKNQEIEEAKLKLMSEYSRSLIEASLDPLVAINIEGKITDMNQATVNITGLEVEKLKGSNFFDYFTEPVKAQEVYEQVFAKGFITDSPLTFRHADGKLTDVLLNGSVYKDTGLNVVGVVLVARDITEQKKISTELTEAITFAKTATVIAEEAKLKAEHATLVAEGAVKSKQQFLSNMSHEIRTPMNAIIGFTKVVLKTDLSAKQREFVNAIKLSGNTLIVLINDILDLAKVDSGKMTFEKIPFRLASSISSMTHLFESKVQEKDIKLITEYDSAIPEVLLGDPVRLHQIILNLVSNAIKFTNIGKITVSVRISKEDDEFVTIQFSIIDTGVGIAANKIDSIFENFQQASSGTSRLYGGTGLGLAIVKQLVEAQGGNIMVNSTINEGSIFSFSLVFQKTSAEIAEEDELLELDSELKNIKVLVVEDMALNQLLMKTLLDDFGFERDIAANGKLAIVKMKKKSYDIILMDLQMPEMDGFETTRYIRNTLKSKIPIIALTADVTTADLVKCKAAGMNDYIAKPVDERILYSKIIGLVKRRIQKGYIPDGMNKTAKIKPEKCTNMSYLRGITKSDPELMMEIIALYLEQTPILVNALKNGLLDKDWNALHAAAHKMIPSFMIVGISSDFEIMAKKVQDYSGTPVNANGIDSLVAQLETVCLKACEELEEEYNSLKYTNS